MDNANNREYLDKIRTSVIENLRRTTFAPSVQMTEVPRESMGAMNDEDDAVLDDLDEDENPDKRTTQRRFERLVQRDGELSESEDEEMAEANGVRRQPGTRKRKNRMDYRNLHEFGADSGVESGVATPGAGSSLPDNDGDEEMNLGDLPPTNGDSKSGPTTDVNPSAVASGAQSPAAAAAETDTNGDVDMQDTVPDAIPTPPAAPVLQEKTPPSSPEPEPEPTATTAAVAAAAPATSSIAGPSEPAVKEEEAVEEAIIAAKNEGEAEREGANVNAEAAAEEAMEAEGTK